MSRVYKPVTGHGHGSPGCGCGLAFFNPRESNTRSPHLTGFDGLQVCQIKIIILYWYHIFSILNLFLYHFYENFFSFSSRSLVSHTFSPPLLSPSPRRWPAITTSPMTNAGLVGSRPTTTNEEDWGGWRLGLNAYRRVSSPKYVSLFLFTNNISI